MWARVFEFSIACWLAMSPFIFSYTKPSWLFVNDFTCSFLIAFFSLLSFHHRLFRMHLFNLALALWLIGLGFCASEAPAAPPLQNYIVLGLILGMIAIVPSHSYLPPKSWQ